MSPAQRFRGLLSAGMRSLFRPLEGPAWLATATLGLCVIAGLVSYHLWQQHGDRILAQPQYRLNPEKLEVTTQPEWIHSDVKQNALTAGRLHDASLLDPELVLQVKQAFGVQPWVKRVLRVNKRYPSSVEVALEYRRPVAMVEVPPGMFPGYDYEGLLPVDDEGVLLPVEVSEQDAQQFPKIGGIDSSPAGPPGSPWGDPRVAAAAQIVRLLEDVWQPLGLYKIDVPPRHLAAEGPVQLDFVLVTKQRRLYNWGSAPGQERTGEERALEKASGLKIFLEKHGPLDAWEDTQATHVSHLIDRRLLK
jgi:hypothetical protein